LRKGLPGKSRKEFNNEVMELLLRMLGISHTKNTKVGSAVVLLVVDDLAAVPLAHLARRNAAVRDVTVDGQESEPVGCAWCSVVPDPGE
jgi:chorismate mutase